jgi:hypothetical protein
MKIPRITDTAKNVFAVFIGCAIAILLVIFIDKTFGWYMDIKGSHSHFFPLGDNANGLGWTMKVKNKKKLQEATKNYFHTRKNVHDGKTIFDVTYNFDTLYRRLVPG